MAEVLWVRFDGRPGPDSCLFVELEDDSGAGRGPDIGVGWKDDGGYALLGPFVSQRDYAALEAERDRLLKIIQGCQQCRSALE